MTDTSPEALLAWCEQCRENQEQLGDLYARNGDCGRADHKRDNAVRWEALAALVAGGKSPCGHWKAYAHTEDGGKLIQCWQCQAEKAEAERDEARRLIKQVEWSATHAGCSCCPWCHVAAYHSHFTDCPAFGQQTSAEP